MDAAHYLGRLDLCGCGHTRGDHEGAKPCACMIKVAEGDKIDCPCASFRLAQAHDLRARELEPTD